MSKSFPIYKQLDEMDCGASCLRMIADHYGRYYSLEYLREITYVGREGVSMLGLSDGAEAIGLRTLAVRTTYERLVKDFPLPCIAYWKQSHFLVVYKITDKHVWIADPAAGKFKLTKEEFLSSWVVGKNDKEDEIGYLLLVETTPSFFEQAGEVVNKKGFSYLFSYIKKYPKLLFQLFLGLFVGSILQILFPLLTQAIVDIGITNQDINFIYLILIAQLILFISQTFIEIFRSWIFLHIGIRVNINLISDFLLKIMKLPIRYFNTRVTGDILQRIADNQRIEEFLTSATLPTLFSVFNFFVFSGILAYYSYLMFLIFVTATFFYILWIIFFLKKRKEIDYRRFDQLSENQTTLMQLVNGMQEIKIHNAEKQKRWVWERIQARMYKVSMQYLQIDQWQRSGASFINETKNILISFIAAKGVIDGTMTLGMMVAVQYIIGQMNGPIEKLVLFFRTAQDAKISLERMNEIHLREDEEDPSTKIKELPENGDLKLSNVSFQYSGPNSPIILNNINVVIPKGKTTAIVGHSGSGKTTLLKLLLNFYAPTAGAIEVGDINLNDLQYRAWRKKCGVVMQEGFIFSDTIANNIALGAEEIDKDKLVKAVKIANAQNFIDSLPLGYNTKIGDEGIDLSQGQKQRLLIARAVYKNPDYIFFDEATNALDAYNEMIILDNLEEVLDQKTVVIVAHRLSTVSIADNIIVLEQGEVIEQGTHEELIELKGFYYYLVKNQLELGR